MSSASDHNLLFGILALQMDFVRREQLVAAASTWLNDKSRRIEQILVEQGALSDEDRGLLARLVERHVENHGGDPHRSLSATSGSTLMMDDLEALGDREIAATLSVLQRDRSTQPQDETVGEKSSVSMAAGIGSAESNDARFRILRSHAKGGLGEVFLARDTELNREVALKEIQARFADDEPSRLRFLLEAEVTGGLEHPGIVPVYGLGRYGDGRPFYAMRFIRGDSLGEAADRFHGQKDAHSPHDAASPSAPGGPPRDLDFGGLEFRKLLGRFIDVCQAIEYAHSRGVLHRDLKPGNIMLGRYGETLVVDWGLAKPLGEAETTGGGEEGPLQPASADGTAPTVMGSAMGTPAFMPPEQAAGRVDELGPASDVYSLGATLYYLLAGQAPFSGGRVRDVLQAVQAGRFAAPRQVQPGVPKALEAICLKAMSPRPGDRYTSAQELAEDVERYLADEAVSAFTEPVSVRLRRWGRKHRTVVGSAAAAAAVLLLALGLVAALQARNNRVLLAANQRERSAREQAEGQSQLALETISSVVFDVQRSLDDLPGGGAVRQALLATVLERMDRLSQEYLEQATVEHYTSAALFELGDAILDVGGVELGGAERPFDVNSYVSPVAAAGGEGLSSEEAVDTPETRSALAIARRLYQRAHAMLRELAESEPDSSMVRHNLATCCYRLGGVELRLGQLDNALQYYQQAHELNQQLAAANPRAVEPRRRMAGSLTELGEVKLHAGEIRPAVDRFRKAHAIISKLATDLPDDPLLQRDLSVTSSRLGDLELQSGRIDEGLRWYSQSLQLRRQLAANDEGGVRARQDLATACQKMGIAYFRMGRIGQAMEYYRQSLAIREELAADDPKDRGAQRNLAGCFHELGRASFQTGQIHRALAYYQRFHDVVRQAADADRADRPLQRDLALSCQRLGEVNGRLDRSDEALGYFRQSLEIRKRLSDAAPDDTGALRELSIAYLDLGSASRQVGQFGPALDFMRQSLEIREELAAGDADDARAQRDLAVVYDGLGDARLEANQLSEAREVFRKANTIFKRLAIADPEDGRAQYDLATSLNKLGDVSLREGQVSEALELYLQSLKLREDLVARDSSHGEALRSLSISYERLGDLTLRLGRSGEALEFFRRNLRVREKLAAAAPGNPQAQLDLSGAYDRLGDLRRDARQFDEAEQFYRQSLEIRRKLVATAPDNALLQLAVSVALDGLGNVSLKKDALREARDYFLESMAIREKLAAAADPADVATQSHPAVSYDRLADVSLRRDQREEGLRYIQKSLALRKKLVKDHPDDGELQRNLTVTYDRLAGLHLESGEVEEALDLYRRSLVTREQLAAADPADARATRDLMSSHYAIGDAHLASGDYRQAAESFGRAAEVSRRMIKSGMNVRQSEAELGACEAKRRAAETMVVALGDWDALLEQPAELLPTLLEARAVECLRQARFDEAARAARQLREVEGATSNQLYNAACVLARAAAVIEPAEGQQELSDAQVVQREACTRDALATLRGAIDAGWDDFDHLKQDEDLALLRDLPEFQALLPAEDGPVVPDTAADG